MNQFFVKEITKKENEYWKGGPWPDASNLLKLRKEKYFDDSFHCCWAMEYGVASIFIR